MGVNSFNNIQEKGAWVAMIGLALLKEKMAVSPYFSTKYSKDYQKEFALGRSMVIPLTQRYITQRNDMTYNPQALDRPATTLPIDQTGTIPLEWESIEKALDMERGEEAVEKDYIRPAVAYARQDIESYLCQFAAQNANMLTTGALGTNPTTYDATSANALQLLTQMGCPTDEEDLGLFLPPSVIRPVKASSATYFNPALDISKQFRTGFVQKSDSFTWYHSNSLYYHTAGTWAAAVTISGANQSGASITVTCTTGDTFNKGDHIAMGSNEVNLMTRTLTSPATATGTKIFAVTAAVTGVAGAATLQITPPIYGPGSHYQNVDALPANGATVTLWPGTVNPNGKTGHLGLALYPGAFLLAHTKLEEPQAVEICKQFQDPETGLGVRFIRQWDNIQSRMTNRLDWCYGAGIGLNEQLAAVIPCA